ncbi:MAG: acyltransferase [Asticcacaulis sp.]|uniref:acyltransferase family protein n=1 Tax=Asticcacaulis sp. TaxID=1872648 RepID=UPI0039E5F51A
MPFRKTTTIACIADNANERPAGFGYLRLFLALGVTTWHAAMVSGQGDQFIHIVANTPWRPLLFFRLPMFFALSGFLISASAARCRTLISFGLLRAFRIFPALIVEVLLSALLLGPLMTQVRLDEYFLSGTSQAYLLSATGWIHFELPGVFTANPLPNSVNLSLWTIPVELGCYAIMALLMVTRHLLAGRMVLILMAVMQLALLVQLFINPARADIIGPQLPLCFIAGTALHLYRHRIRLHWSLAATALAITFLLLERLGGTAVVALPIAYLTVYLGLQLPKLLPVARLGDYSYGIYLYSFPIQQMVATQSWTHKWWLNMALSFPLALVAAIASWHLIEKGFLRLKPWVLKVERALVARLSRLTRRKTPALKTSLPAPSR